jgi:serine/threonine-protein kinase
MFKDEARIAVQLQHGNIAQIYNLGHELDSFYIALEFVAGRDLRAIFDRCKKQRTTVPLAQVCFIVMKVCEGLDYAHNKKDKTGQPLNIVHRDVSPPNIIVSYEGEVKIVDFGVVKAAGRVSQTQAGILKGKFGYMSPEQVKGHPLDRRCDVFSVGVCMWELLTGRRLFHGETDFSTLEKVRSGEVEPPSSINPEIPPELEAIVLKALAAEPTQRYQSASELHDALQAFLFSKELFYSRKDLAAWMRVNYSAEIEAEKERDRNHRPDIERFKLSRRQGDGAGKPSTLPPIPRTTLAPGTALPRPIQAAVAAAVAEAAGEKRTEPPKPRGRAKTLLTSALASPSHPPKAPTELPPSAQAAAAPTPVKKDAASARAGGLEWDDDELETRLFDSPPAESEGGREDSVPPLDDLAGSAQDLARSFAGANTNLAARTRTNDPFDPESLVSNGQDGQRGNGRRRGTTNPAGGTGWSSRTLSRQVAPVAPSYSTEIGEVPKRSPLMIYGAIGGGVVAIGLLFMVFSGGKEGPAENNVNPAAPTSAVDLSAQTGIKVHVQPADAQVTIDATQYLGAADRVAARLPPGQHKVVVEGSTASKTGYVRHEQMVTVENGKFAEINVKLEPKSVKVVISSNEPKAKLSVVAGDLVTKVGRGSGETTIERDPGVSYIIRGETDDGRVVDQPVKFDENDTKEVRLEFAEAAEDEPEVKQPESDRPSVSRSSHSRPKTAAKTAMLKIGTELGLPPAQVYVDGKAAGTTPVRVSVTPGTHKVRWVWKSGQTANESAEVADGGAVSVKGRY